MVWPLYMAWPVNCLTWLTRLWASLLLILRAILLSFRRKFMPLQLNL